MVNNGIKIDTKDLKGLENIKIPEINIDTINAKGLKKEMQQLEKDIAKGAKTIDGEYTNTLNGLRAQLRDMKKELGTLDLDVDADAFADLTDEISELNDKVKQMEQDYGTFSRNVGNYTDSVVDALNEFDGQMYETAGAVEEVKNGVESLKGKQLFDVNIGGQVVQFENISQAIGEIDDMAHRAAAQMMELKNAGKENTEEYKKLNAEFQEFVQKSAELEKARKYADELRDSMTSTTRGLDLGVQAFQALGNAMQMASGIAGLFGQNQEEIEKAINRTVQIMGIMQAAQELYQQTIQKGTFLNSLWTASLAATDKVMKTLGVSVNTTSKSFKLLRGAIAASGIGLLAILVADAVSSLMDMVNGLTKVERKLVSTAQYIDRIKQSTDDWLDEVERINRIKIELGLIDELESTTELLTKYKAEYNLTIKDILSQNKKLEGKWGELFNIDTKKLDVDKAKILKLLSDLSFEYTQSKDIVDKYKQAIADGSEELNEETIATYKNAQSKVILYDSLTRVMGGYSEYIKALNNNNNDNNDDDNDNQDDYADRLKDVKRKIQQDEIEIMKEGFKKEQAQRNLEREWEIEDAKKTGIKVREQINLINEKYNKIDKDALKDFTNELSEIVKENGDNLYDYIFDTQLKINSEIVRSSSQWLETYKDNLKAFTESAERESVEASKTIYGMMDGFKAMSKSGGFKVDTKSFGGFFKSIGNVIKNGWRVITDDVMNYYTEPFSTKALEDNLKKNINEIKRYVLGVEEYFNLQTKQFEREYTLTEENFKALINVTKNSLKELQLAYDSGFISDEQFQKDSDKLNKKIELYEGYYKDVITNTNQNESEINNIIEDYRNKGLKLEELYIGDFIGILYEQQAASEKIEQITYQKLLDAEAEWLTESLKKLSDAEKKELQQLNLTNEQELEIEERYNKEGEKVEAEYKKRVEAITHTHLNNLVDIERDIYEQRSQVLSEYNEAIFNEYDKHYENLNHLVERNSNANQVDMGSQDLSTIGNFAQFTVNSSRFKDEFVKLKDDIVKQKEDLNKQLEEGLITPEVFNLSMSNLNKLEEQTDKTLKSLSKSFIEYSQSIAEVANAVVGIWAQMFSQIADLQYQNEMYRIEQLREDYDKETEILEKAFEEQEELYEKHNQNVESIEGELQTARGDRRLFLLDQINAEMMKREQAWAQQQKIAKQQEQLEKKKEQLEQRQKAAEQKRNKQNQKVQIAQATASTALAVTNALAVQPWFLGVALAAVAAAMGAVQIATIAKQKFADGGVIQGASHSQGGVPVMNGTVEVEGGEYITNKVTTSKNVDVLTFINSKKKKLDLSDFVEFYSTSKSYTKSPKTIFADGGQLPDMQAPMINVRDVINANNQDNRPIYVSVTEINDVQARVRRVQALAGLND